MRFVPVRPERGRSRPDRPREEIDPVEEAARVTLQAMVYDEDSASEKLRPLFASMRRHLFDQDLDLKQIQDDAGVDGSAWKTFREVIGEAPWGYLLKYRLEAGARLLVHTSLKVPEIAKLVGYASASAFRKAFSAFAGMSPALYRRRARKRLKRGGAPPRGMDGQDYWERALSGDLSDEEVRELDGHLAGLFPPGGPPRDGIAGIAVSDRSEAEVWIRMRAEMAMALTAALDTLAWPEQRLLVRDACWFPDTSFFNALCLRSQDVAPEDPERALQLALLAIDSLASNGLLGIDPGLAVLGWTRVARSRWRAGDLPGAEDALAQVARDLERLPEKDREPPIEAERCRLTAALRWFQGRRDEALKMADAAVKQERATRFGFLARTLLLRAEIRAHVDLQVAPSRRRESLRAALEDLDEVRGLADETWGWEGLLAFELRLFALVRLGDRQKMAASLPEVKRVAEDSEEDGMLVRLRWFEGYVSDDPESLWQEAREDFVRLGEEVWGARTTLALLSHETGFHHGTVLHHETVSRHETREDDVGPTPRASELASELAATLGTLAQSSESLVVVKALQSVASSSGTEGSGALKAGVLEAAEVVLSRLDVDRRARRALRFVEV